jgi:hypothetical protein
LSESEKNGLQQNALNIEFSKKKLLRKEKKQKKTATFELPLKW